MVAVPPKSTLSTISDFLVQIAKIGPTLIKTVEDAEPFAQALIDAFHGRTLTDAGIAALEADLAALSQQLQKPLPVDDGKTST